MTGDWGGARRRLEEHAGVEVVGSTDIEAAGRRLDHVRQVSSIGLVLQGRGVARLVHGFAELRSIEAWGNESTFPSRQGLSSLDAERDLGPGEAWLELAAPDEAVRIRAGRAYATADFANVVTAAPFINPSFGLSPALALVPAYPDPTPGASVFLRPHAGLPELGLSVARAAGTGPLGLIQLRHAPAAGAWGWVAGMLAARVLAADGAEGAGNPGAYVTLERAPADDGLGGFVVAARGRGSSGGLASHVAAGLVLQRDLPLGARLAGIALSAYREVEAGPPEAIMEGFLRLQPADWLYLQPELQLYRPLTGGLAGGARATSGATILRFGLRY